MQGGLSAFAASLAGSIVTLPPAHAPAPVTIYIRRGASDAAKIRLESIAFGAARVVRPIAAEWPSGSFSCGRAQYRGGELVFFDGESGFGFGVKPGEPVTVSSGDIERHMVTDVGSHDALAQLALVHALNVETYDTAEAPPPMRTAVPKVSAPSVAALDTIAPRPVGVPSPALALLLVLAGIAICYAGVFRIPAPYWLSTFVTVCGAVVLVYGALVASLGRQRSRRLHEAFLLAEQRTPGVAAAGFGLLIGVALIVWGIAVGVPSIGTKAGTAGLEGIVLMAIGALVAGFFAARIALPAE